MKLKLNEQGAVVVQDGKPVYVYDDGQERAFDAAQTVQKISQLNSEAKGHREAKEAAEAKLKMFEGIEDGEAARKALEMMKNIDEGKLIAAGKVEEIKEAAKRTALEQVAQATRDAEAKFKAVSEQNATLTQQLNSHIIGGSFANSKYISEKMAVPHDIVQAMFANNFKVDNGKLMALDKSGNPIFSATNHGEHADFDEALGMMVNAYPHKDSILKGSGAGGSGAKPGSGGGGDKTVSRQQFGQMSPTAQRDFMKGGGKVSE